MKIINELSKPGLRFADLRVGTSFIWSTDDYDSNTTRVFVKALDDDNNVGFFSFQTSAFHKLTPEQSRDYEVTPVNTILYIKEYDYE